MNKQELIDKLKKLLTKTSEIQGTEFDAGHDYGVRRAIVLTKQLEEQQAQINKPEKPVVPQYVADFYESIKDDFEYGVYELCVNFYNCDLSGKIKHWFDCNDTNPIQVLVNMHQFGYEVEKEKLYTAKLKLTNEYLGYESQLNDLLHYKVPDSSAKEVTAFHFTEDDLVKYHIWGNDTYEVTEVEE